MHWLGSILQVIGVGALVCVITTARGGDKHDPGPLDPSQARTTFQLPPGFAIELVAAEPDIVDPVAMAFDENGRLYVVEMPGYPNAGTAEGSPKYPGRLVLLENPDGHRFRKRTVF